MDIRMAIKAEEFDHPGIRKLIQGATGSSQVMFPPYMYITGRSDPDSQFIPRAGPWVSTVFISYSGDKDG